MRLMLKKAMVLALALCLVAAYTPMAAFADDSGDADESETGTLSCGNGWTLAYEAAEAADGAWEASITAVEEAGAGALAIPEEVTLASGETAVVTELGAGVFQACEELTEIELPDTLVVIGKNALRQTSLASITIPASVAYIPVYCFWKCTKLAEVNFEGSLDHIGFSAFLGCTALEEITIPALKGSEYADARYTAATSTLGSYRLGIKCFYDCTALKKVTLVAGGDSNYFNESVSQFGNNAEGLEIVSYVKHSLSNSLSVSGATIYHAVRFYASVEDCEADEYGTQAQYMAVYPANTKLYDIVYDSDAVADVCYDSEGERPELTEGMVWGVSDSAMSSEYSTIGNTVDVYPVARENLDYGWVSSPEIRAAAGYSESAYITSNQTMVRLSDEGIPDLSGMQAYAADGSELDESAYELFYVQEVTSTEDGRYVSKRTSYIQLFAGEVWEEGTYEVYADGTGDYADTTTATLNENSPTGKTGVSFAVGYYNADVTAYAGESRSQTLGLVELATQTALASSPTFAVVASADDAQQMLIATGLAAVGGGQAIFVDGTDTHDYVYSALSGSGASKVYVLGGEEAVGESVMSSIRSIVESRNGVVSELVAEGSGDAALALAAYEGIEKIAADYEYEWGDVAVVASSTQALASAAVASYVYQGACPVFLADEDGSLSDQALADLAEGRFSKVVLAGPEEYVSAEVQAAIEGATGLEVERLATEGSVYEASLGVLDACEATYGPVDENRVVMAVASDASYVIAGAQYAACIGAEFLIVASSADVKASFSRYAASFGNAMDAAYLVGDFGDADAALEASGCVATYALMETLWDADFTVPEVTAGDTIERAGVLYEVTGAGSVAYTGLAEDALETLGWGSFKHDGTTYDPGDVAAAQFAGNATLKRVRVAATAAVGESAFEGCTALESITVSGGSIGASAFAGCTALASAKLTATGLKTIPASCFSGCTKLATVTIASTALTSVGTKAFYGCKKLKSISLKSAKLTSIGASAFAGCSAMTKATVSSKKLKTIGASAFSGCSKLATVSIASTALTSLGAKAFYGCKKLKSLNLKSAKLKTIGASAFQGCSAMTKLTVSSTALTKISAKALYGCKKLKALTIKTKKLKTVGKNALKGTAKSLTVKVPKAKVKKYKKLLQKRGLNKKAKVTS